MDRRMLYIVSAVLVGLIVLAVLALVILRSPSGAASSPTSQPTTAAGEAAPAVAANTNAAGNAPAAQNQPAATAAPNALPASASTLGDVSTAVYLDNRSGPVELVSSFVNALNRKEYLRAYSYFENPDALGSYAAFAQGYAGTQAVRLATGAVTNDAGAGQINYAVPVTFKVDTTSGKQTFVGCYRLHLSQPAVQATPPFRPLGIQVISVQQVAETADSAALMSRACA